MRHGGTFRRSNKEPWFPIRGEQYYDTDDRYREVDGRMVLIPWYGIYDRWGEFDGMRIPRSAAVSWLMPDGPLTYARFVIDRMEYDIPHPF